MDQRILGDWALLGSGPSTFVTLRIFKRDGNLAGLFTINAPTTPAYIRDIMGNLWDSEYYGGQVVLILNGPAYTAPVASLPVLGTETGSTLSVNFILGRMALIVHQSAPGLEDSDTPTVAWGNITGDINTQGDLQTEFIGKVNTTRTIIAGTGLVGGGSLSADRTLSADFGTAAGKVCQGNDVRLSNARTPTAHANTHKSSGEDEIKLDELGLPTNVTTLNATSSAHGLLPKLDGNDTSCLTGKGTFVTFVAPSITLTAGTGLSGGGDLSTNRTFSVSFGIAAGTACQGNDARLADARTPTAHATSHKSGGTDAIKLDELAATTDVTTLNASSTAHGLLPKLSNVAGEFMSGLGTWVAAVLTSRNINTGVSLSGGGALSADLTLNTVQDIRTTATPAFAAVLTVLARPASNVAMTTRGWDAADGGAGGAGSTITVRGGDAATGMGGALGGGVALRGGTGTTPGSVIVYRSNGATVTLQCNDTGMGAFGAAPVGRQGVYTITAAPAVSTALNADANAGVPYTGLDSTWDGTVYASNASLNDLRADVESLSAVLRQVIKHFGDTSGLGFLDETSF